MDVIDAAVIGGGVVGLACSVSLARRGMQVLVLEADPSIGTGTSSRNSGVIHAGIYYPEHSLKARLCLEGRTQLYAFCEERGVPHKRTGKIIFASHEGEEAELHRIAGHAASAGVDDLAWLSSDEVAAIEPELRCSAALLSPSTGIIDSHALMLALEGELTSSGGQVVCNTRVTRAERSGDRWDLHISGEDGPALSVGALVNSAGLSATAVAETIEGLEAPHIPTPVMARGCYFEYLRAVPFRHLIYPVPVPGGLGTHLTLDLAGRARFGPNVQWIDTIDYTVDPSLKPEFLAAARKIWPGIEADSLQPGYSGIRPKVRTSAGISSDFIISGPADHGLSSLVNLFGIESPGLTASLAIGEEVAQRLS
jgi:L-2-hydroxyglutarate oxidase LhgO